MNLSVDTELFSGTQVKENKLRIIIPLYLELVLGLIIYHFL
jgi:hypothetical protein